MAHKAWNMNGHWVELEHGWWSGVAKLTVDGEAVFERPSPPLYFNLGFAHTFEMDEVPCAVGVVSEVLTFRLEFLAGEMAESVADANQLPIDLRPVQLLVLIISSLVILILTLAVA